VKKSRSSWQRRRHALVLDAETIALPRYAAKITHEAAQVQLLVIAELA